MEYSAKYDDKKILLAFSSADSEKVNEIVIKSSGEKADFMERLRSENGSAEIYASLLPEIADVMSLSTTSLKNRPAEIQLYLEQAYVDYWFCDKATIQERLSQITELGYYAKNEVEAVHHEREKQNNTPETRKETHESEQRLDNAAAVEREIFRQQREAVIREENRTNFFTLEKLRNEAWRIKRQNQQTQAEQIPPERERKNNHA